MSTITKERIELFIKSPLENGITRGEQMELARIALASLEAEPVSQAYNLPELIEGMEVSIDVSTCDADLGTGADLSTGNALDIFGDTAQFGALDSLTTVNNAQREAYGYQVQAANYKAEASSARKQGNVGAATTLLTAPLKAYGAYQMFGGTWSPFTQSTPAPIGAAAGTRLPGGL